jgi:hypothetical protein
VDFLAVDLLLLEVTLALPDLLDLDFLRVAASAGIASANATSSNTAMRPRRSNARGQKADLTVEIGTCDIPNENLGEGADCDECARALKSGPNLT